jgi:NhaA family Na+:H+ antiporter
MPLIPIYTWTKGVRKVELSRQSFRKLPWSQGVILLACVIVAMLLANLPFTRDAYHSILETSLTITTSTPGGGGFSFPREMTVEKFISMQMNV